MSESQSHPVRSDTSTLAKANVFASVAAMLSVLMWFTDTRQLGSFTSIAPAIALCCGMFGVVFSIWAAIRDSRLQFLAFGLWAILPLSWTVYYLLVLHPNSLNP